MHDDPLSWQYAEERDSMPNRASSYLQTLTYCHFEVHRRLTPEAEKKAFQKLAILRELPDRTREVNELRNLIAQLNTGLVINLAMGFRSQGADYLSELIGEGLITLSQCIDRFDLSYNCRFISFAFRSIRRKMSQYYQKTKNKIKAATLEHDNIGVIDDTAIDNLRREEKKILLHSLAKVLTEAERKALFAHYGVIPKDPSHNRAQLDKQRKQAFKIIRKLQLHARNNLIQNSA